MPFVTAMVKGGANGFALKGGDATQGKLTTMWDGPRPQGSQREFAAQVWARTRRMRVCARKCA